MIWSKKKFIMLPILLLGLLTFGCQKGDINLFMKTIENDSVTQFELAQFINSCTLYTNITPDVPANCSNTTRTGLAFFDNNTDSWSQYCCSFKADKCHELNFSSVDDICSSNVNGSVAVAIWDTGGGVFYAECCDSSSFFCYQDRWINISDSSTICDKTASYVTESLTYNYSLANRWDAVCCFGGVD